MSDVKNILSDELESLKLRIIANHEKAGYRDWETDRKSVV